MTDKCIKTLPSIRVSDRLMSELYRLSAHADRKFSDYVRHVLELHVFGEADIISRQCEADNEMRALHCDAEDGGRGRAR